MLACKSGPIFNIHIFFSNECEFLNVQTSWFVKAFKNSISCKQIFASWKIRSKVLPSKSSSIKTVLKNCNIFERKNIVPVGFFLLLQNSEPFDKPESFVKLTESAAEPALKEVA